MQRKVHDPASGGTDPGLSRIEREVEQLRQRERACSEAGIRLRQERLEEEAVLPPMGWIDARERARRHEERIARGITDNHPRDAERPLGMRLLLALTLVCVACRVAREVGWF
jgi:hypothetical protein